MTSRPAVGVMLPRDLDQDRILEFARCADACGFDEFWTVEDLGYRGGIAQTAAVLAVTEKIRVGVGILPAGARNVAFAAMELATLTQMFPGRLDAGIGHGMPGWMRSVGAWPTKPLTLLTEYTRVLTELLEGRSVDLGPDSLLELSDVRLEPCAVPQARPDLLLGVRGPRSLAAAGQVADGIILAEPSTPEYVRAAIAQAAAPRPQRVVAYNVACVDDDGAVAVDAVRSALAMVGEPDWAPHIRPLDFADEFAALRADCADRDEFTRKLPAEWVSRLAVAGTPDQVRGRLGDLAEAGATSVVFIPVGDDPVAQLESLARVL